MVTFNDLRITHIAGEDSVVPVSSEGRGREQNLSHMGKQKQRQDMKNNKKAF